MIRPRILLVGAGRFGKEHLRVWQALDRKGLITLVGIVVKTKHSQKRLETHIGIPVYTTLDIQTLRSVDAVDIATPYQTHFELARRALRYTNVFVEKPLTDTREKAAALRAYAKKHKRILMVGHIYRFHPVVEHLKTFLKQEPVSIQRVTGKFISPLEAWRGESASFEELHLFDILDDVFKKSPSTVWASGTESLLRVDLRYPRAIDARLELGWRPKEKIRELTFYGKEKTVNCDFKRSTITISKGTRERVRHYPLSPEPLLKELTLFVRVLMGESDQYPDAEVGARIVNIAYRAQESVAQQKKRVAVIGGGIFGMTSALILSRFFHVTVFERHSDILKEASYKNQYRHHIGYHYPRSLETVREIQEAKKSFEKMYGAAVMRDFPSYYAVNKTHSLTSTQKFLSFCKNLGLPYRVAYPDAHFLDRSNVRLSVKTPEAAYDYEKFRRIIRKRMHVNKNILVRLNTEVIDVRLESSGEKTFTFRDRGTQKKENFDYVINATYAQRNVFCEWMKFITPPLLFHFKEIVLVKLPTTEKLAVTIIDGPFATLVPTKTPSVFTFGDVPLSVHHTEKGIEHYADRWLKHARSRWPHMKKRCAQWFPILKDAQYIKSMFVVLPIYPQTEKNADRPTDVTAHGFGCFSILSGKIISSVSAAQKIAEEVDQP